MPGILSGKMSPNSVKYRKGILNFSTISGRQLGGKSLGFNRVVYGANEKVWGKKALTSVDTGEAESEKGGSGTSASIFPGRPYSEGI